MAGKFKTYIIRPLRNKIIYYFFYVLLHIGTLMPRKFLLFLNGSIASLVYLLSPHLKSQISNNLTIAYGDKLDKEEKWQIGKNLIVTLTKTITDYGLFWNYKTWEKFGKYCSVEGIENLKNAYDKGKGVICLVPHTVGWEFSAIFPPQLGFTTFAVSSRIHNAALNKLMVDLRESRGMRNVVRGHCYDTLIEGLNNKECLIIMIDQDSHHIRGEFLNFFGKSAYTPLGCARLAYDTGAVVVPMYTVRTDDDKYIFKILQEVPFEVKEEKHASLIYNTQIYNDIIESIVREYPDQWLWIHDRWKTTPESLAAYLKSKGK